MSGQSQVLRAMQQSKDDEDKSGTYKSKNSGYNEKLYSFGDNKDSKDTPIVDADHQLIEDSSNSALINMAISLDPMSAEKVLGRVD